ncbi:MAG: glutamate--tRNA ligase [Candidatus Pacebacteria bacterium]|nr:glutamate--tRNA ligase [Candidatus Paceibacterota bacterium]
MSDSVISPSLFGPRVRMAPSPTGLFHVGSARTALFNYLYARKTGGKFILRIEDTDKQRSKKEYEQNIIDSLKWLGLKWDEGPEVGGEYGPYYQSQRLDIYEKYLKQLLAEDKAYYCFCSLEELKAQELEMLIQGLPPKYSGRCRDLDKSLVEQYLAEGKQPVIRLKMPNSTLKFEDVIRGEIKTDLSLIGDIIIAKGLREPLYNFSVVVDDYLMKITHVIRGEDHISNTPKQIIIQEALGFPRPIYAHLPLILGLDRSKLSKRHGPVSVIEYQKMGYLPEALVNFLALLGWHLSTDEELLSLEELIQKFSLERIQKSGAIFNIKKLDWFNSQYLRKMNLDEVVARAKEYLETYSNFGEFLKQRPSDYLKKVLSVELPRITKFSDLIETSDFFFQEEIIYSQELLIWHNATPQDTIKSLQKALGIIESIPENEFQQANLQIKFFTYINDEPTYQNDKGKLLWPLRVALSGKQASPSPFEIAEVLGKQETIKRIKKAIELIEKNGVAKN